MASVLTRKSGWGGTQEGNRARGSQVSAKLKVTTRYKRIKLQNKTGNSTENQSQDKVGVHAYIRFDDFY